MTDDALLRESLESELPHENKEDGESKRAWNPSCG